MDMQPNSRGDHRRPISSQVICLSIPFNTNMRWDVEPLDFTPLLVSEVKDLYPQVDVFHLSRGITPFMPSPPLSPAQHPIDHKQGVGTGE